MSTDQTALLAAAAGVGAFVLGRLVLQPAGGTDAAAPAATPAAAAATGGSSASLDFPAGDPAGVLSGVYPITDQFGNPVSPTGGGGLPGGGGAVVPPFNPPTPFPSPAPAPAPAPVPTYPYPASLGPKPLTATGYISVHGGAFFRVIPGGVRTSYSGRYFSAWVSGPLLIRWSGGTASVYHVLSGAYIGWYIGVATSVTFRRV